MIRYESSAGTWTLTEVGTFGNISKVSPAPTSNLKPIVKTVAESCGISDMNSIVIHKLHKRSDSNILKESVEIRRNK